MSAQAGNLKVRRYGVGLVAVGIVLLAMGHIMIGITRLDIALLLPEVMKGIGVTTLAAGGLISTLTVLGDGVSEPFLGRLSDTWGRRLTASIGIGLFALCTLLTGLSTSLPEMATVRLFLGVGQGMFLPAWFAFLGGRFQRRRGFVIGALGGMFTVGAAINPLLTRGLYNASGHSWPFPFIVYGIFGLALAASVFLVGRTGIFDSFAVQATGRPGLPGPRAGQGLGGLFGRDMLLILASMVFWGLTQYGYLGLFVTFLRVHQHFPLRSAAEVASIAGWVSFCFSFLGGWLSDVIGRRKALLIFGLCGAVFAYPLFVFSTSLLPAIILASLFEASNGMIYVLGIVYSQDMASANNLGGYTGAASGVGHIVAGFAGLVMGAIAAAAGFLMVAWAFVLGSVIIVVCIFFTRDPRDLSSRAQEREAVLSAGGR